MQRLISINLGNVLVVAVLGGPSATPKGFIVVPSVTFGGPICILPFDFHTNVDFTTKKFYIHF